MDATLVPVVKYVDYTYNEGRRSLTVRGYLKDHNARFLSDFELTNRGLRFVNPQTFKGTPLTNEQLRADYASVVNRDSKQAIVTAIMVIIQSDVLMTGEAIQNTIWK